MDKFIFNDLGFVVIGRNEVERLKSSLPVLLASSRIVVYVDSGSTDASVDLVKNFNVHVVQLDLSKPFTAARARNKGFDELIKLYPETKYIQFIDGDCELNLDWVDFGRSYIEKHKDVAIVCGRRAEIKPHESIYNLLCDLEWNSPVGNALYCGGDFMVRVEAFRDVGGFREQLIAGEEPELCIRLRNKMWKIFRLDHDMTYHDAKIYKFSQYWKRSVRSGYAYLEVGLLHSEFGTREVLSIVFWSVILPSLILSSIFFKSNLYIFILFLYLVLLIKVTASMLKKGNLFSHSLIYGISCLIIKFPQAVGCFWFLFSKISSKSQNIIEYK